MSEVTAKRVDDLFDGENRPGSFKPYSTQQNSPAGINFICPCGCGEIGRVNFALPGQEGGWSWNGDLDKPTVQPSVYFNRGRPGEWHGYLTDGVWRSC